jgi:hypothetical protein
MATMLSWFLIEDFIGDEVKRPTLGNFFSGGAPRAAYALVVLFAALQLVPLLYRGDSTLNGQGRLFTLHMFEARQVCEVTATLHYANLRSTRINLKMPDLPPRIVCDPVVYYSRIRNICHARLSGSGLVNADLQMKVKRTTDKVFQTIIDEPNFCSPKHEYSVFLNNSWIK